MENPIENKHEIYFMANPIYKLLVGGFNPSEKYEFVGWDGYSIPNMMGKSKIKFHGSSHHQPDHHHIPIVVGL